MRAGLIAHDLIGGSAWAYMKIKLIYWVRGKRHILVSKATFFHSFFFFYCVTTRWNEYKMDGLLLLRANRPATKAISLLASGTWFFFFFFSFIDHPSSLRISPLKAAQLWVIQVGSLHHHSPGMHVIKLWYPEGADCETPTVFVTSRKKKDDIRWLLGVYCVLPALL